MWHYELTSKCANALFDKFSWQKSISMSFWPICDQCQALCTQNISEIRKIVF